jgi:alpha-tubulin suppressor-like RCC1 family protein
VAGDFDQVYVGSNWESFQASGTHRTVLNGTTGQTVSFVNPGATGQTSFFRDLEITNTAGVTFSTNAVANGKLRVGAAAALTGAGTVTVGDSIVTVTGSSIGTAGVRVGGAMGVSGSFSPALTEFFGGGTVVQPGLAYQNVLVTGQVSLGGTTTFAGDLTIHRIANQPVGSLTLAGRRLNVGGDFRTGVGSDASGLLTMQNAADTLAIGGDATFAGSPLIGTLTEGVLLVAGDFSQVYIGSNWESFQASGTHRTILNGTTGQTVSFVNPGATGQTSFFRDLEITNAAGVTFSTNAVANGKLRVGAVAALTGAGTITVGDSLVTAAASSITTGGMRSAGGMSIAGTFSPTLTEFFGSGTVVQPGLAYQNVLVTGQVSLGGTTTFAGDLTINRIPNQPAGNLTLAGRRLNVGGDFRTGVGSDASGLLTMQNAADTLAIADDATFAGSPLVGTLTAGVLLVSGDFSQAYVGSNWESFQASGTHRTVLSGSGAQTVSFTNPAPGGQASFFQHLELRNTGGVALATAAYANGQLRARSGGTQTVTGGGNALNVRGLDVDSLVLANAPLTSTDGTIARFDDVTLQGFAATATQLAISHPGIASPLTFNRVAFLTAPTSGYYVSATDSAPVDGNVLTIRLADSTPADGSARTSTAGGAVVTWLGAEVPPLTAINAGTSFSCGLAQSGKPFCWGQNFDGTVGDGTTMQRNQPTAVAGGLTLNVIATGAAHACGLALGGAAYCWGSNGSGQLGDNSTTNSLVPVPVATGLAFTLLSAGDQHTCGRTAAGALYCWGANGNGQLGDGTTTDRLVPTAVTGGLSFVTMSAGGSHTCALTAGNVAYCWGSNSFGQLGDNSGAQQTAPSAVAGGLSFNRLFVATSHSCALEPNGAAHCWGWNGSGELGNGTTTASGVPVAVSGGLAFNSISPGGAFTCGVTNSGAGYCWGLNDAGQLGDGTNTQRTTPVAVAGGISIQSIDAGFAHVSAIDTNGAGRSWGANGSGQLGNGTTTSSTVPVTVLPSN